MQSPQLQHPTYTLVPEQEADAVAWAFVDRDNMKKIGFKFPEIKPNEARAKVLYAGLCLTDSHAVREELGPCVYPVAPGHEIVCIITQVGSDVTNIKVGETLGFGPFRECCGACEYCNLTYDQLCRGKIEQLVVHGDKYWGGYASHIQQPADFFFKLPTNIPLERIPPLFCAGTTAYTAVANYAKPGEEVAVLGVGGVGHLAVMYAKAWGCNVTAFTSSKDKEALIKDLGADKVIVTNEGTFRQEAGKYHLVLNTLPEGQKLNDYIGLVRPRGKFCQLGVPDVAKPSPITPFLLIFNQVSIVSAFCGSRKETRETLEFSAKNNIVPLCEMFDFEDFPKAYDKLVNGKPIFRCVVDASKFSLKH